MTSSLSWVDFDQNEQDRVKNLIGIFNETSTVDELGAGTLRDAVSDALFPGTSTLHTHVKYMLMVPWLCIQLERKGLSSNDFSRKLDRDERRLIPVLKGTSSWGVIGGEKPETVQRLPSEIYWGGLRTWGLHKLDGSRANYARVLKALYGETESKKLGDDTDERKSKRSSKAWHEIVHDLIPRNFPDEANFALSSEEQNALKLIIETNCKGTLLSSLVTNKFDIEGIEFPWQLDRQEHGSSRFAKAHLIIDHAEMMSLAMHGASMAYYLHCSLASGLEDRISDIQRKIALWCGKVAEHKTNLQNWNIDELFHLCSIINPRINRHNGIYRFVHEWRSEILSRSISEATMQDSRTHSMIQKRELQVKSAPWARLSNQSLLKKWGRSSMPEPLSFRWGNAKNFIQEITNPKENS